MVAAATIGGAVLGAGASMSGANKASKAADRQTAAAERASERELAFAREQYDDWQKVFGPIQDNLAEYYNNLTPEFYESQGLQAAEMERAVMLERVNQNFAQRGISGSGLAAATEAQIEMGTAESRAQARAEAPMKAAQEKLGFLQVGLGQNPAGNMTNALGRNTNTQFQLASNAQSQAGTANIAAGQAIADASNTIFTTLGEKFGEDDGG